VRLFEAIAATARATRRRAGTDEILREQLEVTRRALREQIEKQFAPELDAMIALFSEGDLDPTPERVASRAGISPRSVYRYFDDREALLRAAIGHQLDSVWHLYILHRIGEGPLDERVADFVGHRVRLHEVVGAAARATRLRAVTDEILREQLELTRRALREQIEKQFAPELEAMPARTRRARVAAMDALCELEALDHYRLHRGFSTTDTEALLVDALRALLTP
jgi:AcrR family transcriptional regulator